MYLFLLFIASTVLASALIGSPFRNFAETIWLAILVAALFCFRNTLKLARNIVVMGFQR